ncbi:MULTISPECIES: hypothetical protein [unclassified Methylobacterium]|jgi:hypothetical protein|uniref:hypothetical protein n=1 Tax=unclassified Methylobacterium TaxID=2615210 RepID=UPI001355F0A0|nr:hypothetical protein [Methylobacterium sp. 2A]MWV24772.1 hypothetical protein [Methylobacterium sp. 2A]
MTDLLEKAVAKARDLSPDLQDEIARLMLAFVGDEDSVYRFTPEEAAELDESEAAEARGDFATEAEIRAIWAKYGL